MYTADLLFGLGDGGKGIKQLLGGYIKIVKTNDRKILGDIEDIDIVVETNGVNLTLVTISCPTQLGSVTIRTSYTYNAQELFPESDDAE